MNMLVLVGTAVASPFWRTSSFDFLGFKACNLSNCLMNRWSMAANKKAMVRSAAS
jgi:hypothetical protein